MSSSLPSQSQSMHSEPATSLGDHLAAFVRPLAIIIFATVALYYAVVSVHWRITGDGTVMHYVVFLMHHGFRPYTQITDNNFPGAYYTEASAMRIFGTSDIAWRIYDYFLLAVMTGALIVIARSRDRIAGVFAAGMFITLHAPEGPAFSVEREQIIMVLLLVGYAALFTAVRRSAPALLVILGLTGGIASSIKPTFLPLPFALLLLMAVVLHRRKISVIPYLSWALLGFVAIFALDVGFLVHYHVLKAFFFILRTVSATYASTARLSLRAMLAAALPRNMRLLPLLLAAPILALARNHFKWTWEQWSIAIGFAFGLLSFFAQGKGFEHHRYTFIVMFFLLVGFELFAALQIRGWPRVLSFLALAFIFLWLIPQDLRATHPASRDPGPMQTDLQHLDQVSDLQGKVQCFDMVYGCFGALYHLHLVENTAFTGDLLFFTNSQGPAALYYKSKFWDLAHRNPATVLVVTNEWFGHPNSFDKLNAWPEFATYLAKNYTLVTEQRLSPNSLEENPNRFRIYIRNNTSLLNQAEILKQSGAL